MTMRTQTVVFQDPIGKFEDLLKRLRECPPLRMETTTERNRLRREIRQLVPSFKGIYVFYEKEEGKENPLYVGRTDQMADRLLNHGRKPNADVQSSATFALILAKNEFRRTFSVQYDLFGKELAKELSGQRIKKMELWMDAVNRVKRMLVRVVEVEHPHEQAVFEVYVHEKLKTPFNSFANH